MRSTSVGAANEQPTSVGEQVVVKPKVLPPIIAR